MTTKDAIELIYESVSKKQLISMLITRNNQFINIQVTSISNLKLAYLKPFTPQFGTICPSL